MSETKVLGIKLPINLYNEIQEKISESGKTSGEWIQSFMALQEVNELKTNSSEFTKDLNELELHTTRIYELVVNMIQQSTYLKDAAVQEVTNKLSSTEGVISQLQQNLAESKDKVKQLTELTDALTEEKSVLTNKLEEQKQFIENNNLLISEYKEKNDTLSGLVAKYQSFSDENEHLKAEFETFKTNSEEQRKILLDENNRFEQIIKDLSAELNSTKKDFERDIEILKERNQLEKATAVLETERAYQAKLEAQSDKYNQKIESLQNENERIRDNYESKLKSELERVKNDYEKKFNELVAKQDEE